MMSSVIVQCIENTVDNRYLYIDEEVENFCIDRRIKRHFRLQKGNKIKYTYVYKMYDTLNAK